VADPVNVTEHEPDTSVHVGALNVPAAPALDQVTVPVGVVVGATEVSVTVAVHVDACPTTTGVVHVTTVAVVLALTVIEPLPELPEWMLSPP